MPSRRSPSQDLAPPGFRGVTTQKSRMKKTSPKLCQVSGCTANSTPIVSVSSWRRHLQRCRANIPTEIMIHILSYQLVFFGSRSWDLALCYTSRRTNVLVSDPLSIYIFITWMGFLNHVNLCKSSGVSRFEPWIHTHSTVEQLRCEISSDYETCIRLNVSRLKLAASLSAELLYLSIDLATCTSLVRHTCLHAEAFLKNQVKFIK